MSKKYPLFDIYWDEEDVKRISDVIRRGSYWASGPEIVQFEQALGDYLGIKYIVTFNSGTSALHAALLAYDITEGEVIVPSLSFISTANCVILAGAKPVFAEIEEQTIGLEANDVLNKITNKTQAIIPMHYGGRICRDIIDLKEIAKDYGLKLIEDNAESFGAKYKQFLAGSIGDAGMLSFCQNKIITTGEGGAICTNDEEIYKKLLLVRSHGRVEKQGTDYFSDIQESEYIQIGYNFRMPTLCAALGISQLNKIEKILELKRVKGKYYDNGLNNISDIEVLPELESFFNVYQLYSILLKNQDKREALQNYLFENGISTKVYFYPIHLKSFYRRVYGLKPGDLPITEKVSQKILTLPISLNFTDKDQDFIIKKINEFFNRA